VRANSKMRLTAYQQWLEQVFLPYLDNVHQNARGDDDHVNGNTEQSHQHAPERPWSDGIMT